MIYINDRMPLASVPKALGGGYVVSASEMRVASVWTVLDGRLLCTITDERRISGRLNRRKVKAMEQFKVDQSKFERHLFLWTYWFLFLCIVVT